MARPKPVSSWKESNSKPVISTPWMHENPPHKAPVIPRGINPLHPPTFEKHKVVLRQCLLHETHRIIRGQIRRGEPIRLPTGQLRERFGYSKNLISKLANVVAKKKGKTPSAGGPNNKVYTNQLIVLKGRIRELIARGVKSVQFDAILEYVRKNSSGEIEPGSLPHYFYKYVNETGGRLTLEGAPKKRKESAARLSGQEVYDPWA